jgi:hypothetical protein
MLLFLCTIEDRHRDLEAVEIEGKSVGLYKQARDMIINRVTS